MESTSQLRRFKNSLDSLGIRRRTQEISMSTGLQPGAAMVSQRRVCITRALTDEQSRSEGCSACQGTGVVHSLACRARWENLVRGADAKEANKQEDEAISPESPHENLTMLTRRKDTLTSHRRCDESPPKPHAQIRCTGKLKHLGQDQHPTQQPKWSNLEEWCDRVIQSRVLWRTKQRR